MQLLDHAGQGPRKLAQPGAIHETVELEVERAAPGVGIEPGDRLRRLLCDLLDVHAAARRQHQDVGAGVAVDREAQVDLAVDLERRFAVDKRHLEALDVHADDLLGRLASVVGGACELDAAGFAPTADGDLRLDRDGSEIGARPRRLVRGARDPAGRDGDAERRKHLFGLVLEQLHLGKRNERRRVALTSARDQEMKRWVVGVPALVALMACGVVPPVGFVGSPAASAARTASPFSTPGTRLPVDAVLVDLTTHTSSYTVSLVSSDGGVSLQMVGLKRSEIVAHDGHAIQLPYVSTSLSSLYYLDGDSV